MLNLVPLLIAAALVSLHSASGALLTNKIDSDNTGNGNGVPTQRRIFRKYVKILKAPEPTVRLLPGQRLELKCEALASPSPAITWLKNGEPIRDYEDQANEVLPVPTMSIALLSSKLILNGAVDGDVYTCLAKSGVKQTSASSTVYIGEEEDASILLEKLLVPPKPIITSHYTDVFQTISTSIVLPCRVYGDAQVYWQDEQLNLIYDNARMRVLPSGDLLIQELRWTDMGKFLCVAQNDYGTDTAATFLYPVQPS